MDRFKQSWPILFLLPAKILQSHLLTQNSYWVNENNLLMTFFWLALKKWYELSVSQSLVKINAVLCLLTLQLKISTVWNFLWNSLGTGSWGVNYVTFSIASLFTFQQWTDAKTLVLFVRICESCIKLTVDAAIKFQFNLFDIKSLVPLDMVACVRDDPQRYS